LIAPRFSNPLILSLSCEVSMRSILLLLIDLLWLVSAIGFLIWGSILLFKQRRRWRRGLGFAILGAFLMAARYMDCVWLFIHKCLGV